MTVLYEVRHVDGTKLNDGPQTCFSTIARYGLHRNPEPANVTSIKYWPMPSNTLSIVEVDTYLREAATIIPELRHKTYEDLIRGFTISGKLPGQYINFVFKILRLMHEKPAQVRAVVRMCNGVEVRLPEKDPWGSHRTMSVRVPFPLALALSTDINRWNSEYSQPVGSLVTGHIHHYFFGYSRKLVANLMQGKKAYRKLESYRTAKYLYNNDEYDWDKLYGIPADAMRPRTKCALGASRPWNLEGLRINETSLYEDRVIKKFIVDEVIHFYETHTKPNAWNARISPEFLARLKTYVGVV